MPCPSIQTGLLASATLISKQRVNLAHLWIFNPSNATAFLQLFNTNATGNVSVGTTAPDMSFGVKTLTSESIPLGAVGVWFPQGIVAVCTTTYNGSSAPNTGVQVQFAFEP